MEVLFISVLLFGLLLFIALFLLRRCHIYAYVDNDGKKMAVRVACITSDGTILDTTQHRGSRRVGQVYVREGKGYVRLYRPDLGQDEYDEMGYVDEEGNIYNMDGALLSKISPEGKRYWWDLYLRLHAEIPEGEEPYKGKCVETLRFRARNPGEITLLARGGAAFILYCLNMKRADDVPRLARTAVWDTSLLAALVFAITFLFPGMTKTIEQNPFIFSALGSPWSYVATGLFVFLLIWLFLHFTKITLLSYNNEILTYLAMLNRETGIEKWGIGGIIISILGIAGKQIEPALGPYVPIFLSSLTGFALTYSQAPRNPWVVKPRSRAEIPRRLNPPVITEGSIVRRYEWEIGSAFKNLYLSTEVRYKEGEIDQIRETNPFYRDWQEAMASEWRVAEQLVQDGEKSPHVQQIADYIKDISRDNLLTVYEEIQTVLNFVQEPNISYKLDAESDEVKNAAEYFRLPAETLYDKRGDCDCKAILAAALMRSLGYPVLLLLSPRAKHAAIAIGNAPEDAPEGIFFFKYKGKPYYYCETTTEGWKVGQPTDVAWLMTADQQSIINLTD